MMEHSLRLSSTRLGQVVQLLVLPRVIIQLIGSRFAESQKTKPITCDCEDRLY